MTSGSPPWTAAASFNWFRSAAVFALIFAALAATHKSRIADEAYISFRCAENFLHHKGLVFNPGEPGEEPGSPGWTLWIAAGMWLHVDPEHGSVFSGIFFFVATVALLIRYRSHLGQSAIGQIALPVAALLAALHREWILYASSGLETAFFTFLVTAAFFLAVDAKSTRPRLFLAGALMGLAIWIRWDGVILFASMTLVLASRHRLAERRLFVFVMPAAILAALWLLWRYTVYGSFIPETAFRPGMTDAAGYFKRYWCLLLWVPLLPWMLRGGSSLRLRAIRKELIFLLMLALPYIGYAVFAGGDFLFGRTLLPVTPFLALLVELGIAAVFAASRHQLAASTLVLASLVFTPLSVAGLIPIRGIIDERTYSTIVVTAKDEPGKGEALKAYFQNLPVRIGFFSGQARLVYESKVASARNCDIPSACDPEHGDVLLILDHRTPYSWNRSIPYVPIALDGIQGRLLYWDPEVLSVLKARGASVPDFPRELDSYLEHLPAKSRDEVRRDYARFKLFYFSRVQDPSREQKFLRVLRDSAVSLRLYPNVALAAYPTPS